MPLRSNRRQLFPLTLSSPVPVLLCAGSVIPTRQRARRSVALAMHDPLTLTVTLTRDYRATGEWYLDDGESFLYTRGHFFHKIMSVTGRTGSDQVSHRSLHMNVVDKNLHHARARHNNTAAHARAHNWQRPFLGEVNARTDEDMWLTTNPEYLAGSARRVGIERIVVLGVAGKADPSTVRLRIRRGDDGAPWSELDASLHAQIRVHRHADAPFGQEVAGSNGVLATWELIIKNPGVDAGQDWAMSVEW